MLQTFNERFRAILIVFGVILLIVIFRLLSFQVSGGYQTKFRAAAEANISQTVDDPAPRGTIYDRNGHILATNEVRYRITIDPTEVKDPAQLAQELGALLSASAEQWRQWGLYYNPATEQYENPTVANLSNWVNIDYWLQTLGAPIRYVRVTEYAPEAIGKEISRLQTEEGKLYGVHLANTWWRTYPESSLAANVLGYMHGGVGVAGIEGYYEWLLAGKLQSGPRYNIPFLAQLNRAPENGYDLYLTIDRDVQYIAQDALNQAIQRFDAQSGSILVLDPQTGDVLALATNPTFDPNEPLNVDPAIASQQTTLRRNQVVSEVYEPGSTFKVITASAALDSGKFTRQSSYYDNGILEWGGASIRNWNGGGWGQQDFQGILQHSLNVGTSWWSTTLGATQFYNYVNAFGFGSLANIDLLGEERGRVKSPGDSDWYESDLATNSFGQGISVTPLQLAVGAGAIANHGIIMQPHVLMRVDDGLNLHQVQPTRLGAPISDQTATTLTDILADALEGEASGALVAGYRLAGKTGTAEIPDPVLGYVSDQTIASFLGWGPVENPRFLVLIKLDRPNGSIWGSQTAAPTFAEFVRRLVVVQEIPPSQTDTQP